MWSSLCGRMSSLLLGKYLAGRGGGGIVASYGKNCQTVVQSSCTILRFHQQCKRASVASHHQLLVLPGL